MAIFYGYCQFYLRLAMADSAHRMGYAIMTIAGFAPFPDTFSVLGWPTFFVILSSGFILGELAGHAASHAMHTSFADQQEERRRHEVQEVMSKARTRAAEVTAESALVEAREATIRADAERRMNDFLAHEIRNPLSVAVMAVDFIALNNDVPAAMQNDLPSPLVTSSSSRSCLRRLSTYTSSNKARLSWLTSGARSCTMCSNR
jgi:signal transduction histidine kinase